MKKNIPFLAMIILVFVSIFTVNAQNSWSLIQCVDYAVENNIDLNISYHQVDLQETNLLESKANLLPDLNLGSTLNLNFGRNIDGNSNNITYDPTLSNNYWINSSVNIFQGLVKYNTISFNKYLLSARKEESSFIKNKLVFSVLTSYYMVLYTTGLEDVAKSQVELSKMQFERMQKLVDVGRESPITVQDLKSQWAGDKLSLTRAKNNVSKSLLDLKQLLRLDANQVFAIDSLNISAFSVIEKQDVDSLYNRAVNVLPEIKQQEFLFKASEKDLSVAKGGISPRVYVSAGFNTGYYDGDSLNFNSQITTNQNPWVNMGVVIPIFNNAMVYSRIKRKQIAVKDQQLALEKQYDILYTEIWKAIDELQSAENEYYSALELYEFSDLSLKNVTKKLETGLASTTDYQVAKQRYTFAKATLLKAQLIYMMRKQMLEFYKTGDWSHLGA